MYIAVGDDFWGLCDQKRSYKQESDFERLRIYDSLKLKQKISDDY
jgi:hypothetical protein